MVSKGMIMNKKLSTALLSTLFCTVPLSARTVSGTITNADNGTPVNGIMVSDGYSFAGSDANGNYTIDLHPKAETIYVHRPDGLFTEDFYYLLDPACSTYDFELFSVPSNKGEAVDIVVIGDSETTDTSYFSELEEYIADHPEIDFVFNSGDINGRNGMQAHRDNISLDTFCRPVHYVIGNHDIIKRNPGEADCFTELIAPWYYTFEVNGILFITAPMYNSWGVPLPYSMKEYGDWLKKLLEIYPAEQPKVLMAHDIPDLVGDRVCSNSGDIMLDDYNFRAILYGHKHMNIVMHYPSGRSAYATTTTTFAGVGFHAPGFRHVTIPADAPSFSTAHYSKLDELLQAGSDGRTVWATVYNSGDEVRSVTVTYSDGETAELFQANTLSWGNAIPEGKEAVSVTAVTNSGAEFSADVISSGLRMLTVLPQETAIADLIADGDTLYAAVVDDTNALNGGIYAISAATGEILWFCNTGYSIRNNIAQDSEAVYWTDARGNIGATAKADGSLLWFNPVDTAHLNPTTAAVTVADGIVIGGYGRILRGIDAASGSTIWTNDKWEERTPSKDKLTCSNGMVYVISQVNGLYAHDIRTGEIKWHHKLLFMAGSVCADGDTVYVKGENDLLKLNALTGEVIAKKYIGGLKSASVPVVYGDMLIFGTAFKGIMAVNRNDLSTIWQYNVGNALIDTVYYARKPSLSVESTPEIIGDTVWFGANDGMFYQLDAATGNEKGKYFTGAPVTAKGVRGNDGAYYFADMAGKIMVLE